MNCFGCGDSIRKIKLEFGCAPFCQNCHEFARIEDKEMSDAFKSKPPRAEGYFGANEYEELELESLSLELLEPQGWSPSWGFESASDLSDQNLVVSTRLKV